MSWQELKGFKEQRAQIKAEAQAILDNSGNRALTDDEKTKFDGLLEQSRGLATQIETLVGLAEMSYNGTRPPMDGIGDGAGQTRDLGGPFSPLKDEWEKRTLKNRSASDEPLSLGKFLRGSLCGQWEGDSAERRAMSTTATGSVVVPTPLSASLIQGAFNESRVMQAGAMVVPMDSATLKLARATGAPQAGWKAENAAFNVDDSPLDSITLTPKMLGVVVKLSLELAQDGQNVDSIIEQSMSKAMGLALDSAGLFGTGANNQPTGVANTTGIQTIASVGTLVDYSKFSQAITKIYNANGNPNACILSPNTFGVLDNLQNTLHDALKKPDSVANLPFLPTNQIPLQPITATVTGIPTGGTFKLSLTTANGSTQQTGTIAYNATAATVATALTALSNVGSDPAGTSRVTVTGSAGGPYTINFQSQVGLTGAVTMTADGSALTGGTSPGVTIAATTSAFVADWRQLLVGMRQNIVLEMTREAADSNSSAWVNGQIWLRCWLRADFQLAHPSQFVQLTGIAAS